TQLTLRTFHVGGTASNIAAESQINARFEGIIEFENVRTVPFETAEDGKVEVVLGRSGEFRIVEAGSNKVIVTNNIPYGSFLYVKDGSKISKGDRICSWDPYNAVIISEFAGVAQFDAVLEGITFREESDEQTGHREKVIIDTRDKTKNPAIQIADSKGNAIKGYNIPVGAHIAVDEGEKVKKGQE